MSDNIEQRFVTGGVNPDTNSELHKYPVLNDEEELLEMNEEFCLDDFQVVRREFFAHLREPAVTFNNRKFYVNSACLTKFPNTDYVQALINPDSKILALRPCGEGERGAFQWCSLSQGKRKPRQTTCTLFFLKMFDMMNWNPDHRYKMLGNIIHAIHSCVQPLVFTPSFCAHNRFRYTVASCCCAGERLSRKSLIEMFCPSSKHSGVHPPQSFSFLTMIVFLSCSSKERISLYPILLRTLIS